MLICPECKKRNGMLETLRKEIATLKEKLAATKNTDEWEQEGVELLRESNQSMDWFAKRLNWMSREPNTRLQEAKK